MQPLQPALETTLECHGHAVTLRASLRAAVAIDNMPGGVPRTWEQVSRWSYSAIRGVILASATDRQAAERLLAATADKPLVTFVPLAQAACLAVMAAILPTGDDSADQAPSQGSANAGATVPLREYFKSLYQYATGWLGWTPEDTWASSPAEIAEAFTAHVNRLVVLTPGAVPSDKKQASAVYAPEKLQLNEQGFDPEFDREGLRALKARHCTS